MGSLIFCTNYRVKMVWKTMCCCLSLRKGTFLILYLNLVSFNILLTYVVDRANLFLDRYRYWISIIRILNNSVLTYLMFRGVSFFRCFKIWAHVVFQLIDVWNLIEVFPTLPQKHPIIYLLILIACGTGFFIELAAIITLYLEQVRRNCHIYLIFLACCH